MDVVTVLSPKKTPLDLGVIDINFLLAKFVPLTLAKVAVEVTVIAPDTKDVLTFSLVTVTF